MNIPPLKIAEVIGAWVGFSIGVFVLPIFFFPIFLIGWIFWSTPSPNAVYSAIYDNAKIACFILLLLVFWLEAFKAELGEAKTLAQAKNDPSKSNWLWRHYLNRNKELIRHFVIYESYDTEDQSFETYLMMRNTTLYRHHTTAMAYMPDWLMVQNVSAHTRRGHTRYTRSGPVEIRSHGVRNHTRTRNR